jgi:hypothetical protein
VRQRGGDATSLRHGILCLNVQRRWKHRCPYKLYCHWSNISIILGSSNNGSRWVFGPPSLLLTYIYLDLPTSIRSGYSAGSFGCPTVLLHCTEPFPVCGTSMAAPLVWPCLPLDRHTRYSNMVNTCLRDCSEPNCPALWDLYVCHRDFTRQLLWALWRHM